MAWEELRRLTEEKRKATIQSKPSFVMIQAYSGGRSLITPISMNASAKRALGLKVWKDHLTLVPCGNTAGHKSKWANNPQALKHQTENHLHLFWHHNKKTWVMAILLLEWFHQCLIPKRKKHFEERALPFTSFLVTDITLAPGHPSLCFSCWEYGSDVSASCTASLLQPLDQGIIKCTKVTHTPLTFRRKWRGTKKPLDESESGEWKSWLKAQHSENEDHGIRSHHFMGNSWGNSGNSVRLYFWGLQNHYRWWLQPWN